MSDGADSPWSRVAHLKIKLRRRVQCVRHYYRGEPWYVLQGRSARATYRLSVPASQFIGLLDGKSTVAEAFDTAAITLGAQAPTQWEVVDLLAALNGADLLEFSAGSGGGADILERRDAVRRHKRRMRMFQPLIRRIRLANPEPMMKSLGLFARLLFSPAGLLLWLVIVAVGLLVGLNSSAELSAFLEGRSVEPVTLALLWLAYPMVKGVHELAHALATLCAGGRVREFGLRLLGIVPAPYMDISASNGFSHKGKRIMVAAAGMFADALMVSVGVMLGVALGAGSLVSDLAFSVALVAGISTLFVNGNPLFRLDAYYVMSELAEIPNLERRSVQYLGFLAMRKLFAMKNPRLPVMAVGETPWLIGYAPAAFVWRLGVGLGAAALIGSKMPVAGAVVALLVVTILIVYPGARVLGHVLHGPELKQQRAKVISLASIAGLLVILVGGLFTLTGL